MVRLGFPNGLVPKWAKVSENKTKVSENKTFKAAPFQKLPLKTT